MIGLLQGRLEATDSAWAIHGYARHAAALHKKVQAVIEFDLQGHVLAANDNFLSAMGYTSAQIGASITACLSMKPPASQTNTRSSGNAWLPAFMTVAAITASIAKGRMWLQASYNPHF